MEKRSLEESIHGILTNENASFVKISDVELTFKRDLESPITSRSTGSILVMTIGPFDENNARGIKEIVDGFFFDRFVQANENTPFVLEAISKASK